jgi:Protein of unknown function (DUF2569)
VLGPPWNAFRTHQRWHSLEAQVGAYAQSAEFGQLQQSAWILYVAGTAIGVATGLLLVLKRRPSSVWTAICGLWIAGLILPILGYAYGLHITGEQMKLSDLSFVLVQMLSVGLWTAYLFMSKRVKNTYSFRQRGTS